MRNESRVKPDRNSQLDWEARTDSNANLIKPKTLYDLGSFAGKNEGMWDQNFLILKIRFSVYLTCKAVSMKVKQESTKTKISRTRKK